MLNTVITYVLKDGELQPAESKDRAKLKLFKNALKEGDKVEVYLTKMEVSNKTLGQLAKVHASIRDLANFTGYTFEEMKSEVKVRAGLYRYVNEGKEVELKSFGECTKDELSSAITATVEIGDAVGYSIAEEEKMSS